MGRKMGRKPDPIFEKMREEMGAAEFKKLYNNLYNTTRESRSRYSGDRYENSPEKLQAIKEKYKNGVTKELLDEFIKSL